MSATIGIVDDDPAVRKALCRLVSSMGLRPVAFGAPAELLARGLDPAIACLVLDLRLPGMDGLALYRRLRDASGPVPVIFITAHHDGAARARALELGAVAFLPKPFDDGAFFDAIRRALPAEAGAALGGAPASPR